MSEKQQPGSPASDKIADLETLQLQAVTGASNINGNISPASPVVANDEDDETTIKRAIIRRNTRNDEVSSSGNSWPDQHAGDKTQASSDACEQETPFVEQLEFPPRKQPFQVEVSLFDTLNLPTVSAEVSLVDMLTLPTHPTMTPFAGSLPDTPNEIEPAALVHGNISRDASHEHFEIPQHLSHATQNTSRFPLVHALAYPLKLPLHLWRFSSLLFVLALLVPLLGAGSLEYKQLNQTRDSMYQVNLLTGSTQWQHTITSPMQIATIDNQGSLLITSTGAQQRQLEAFDRDGMLEWHTVASKETFSLPSAASPAGTVLVALSSISPMSPAASGGSAAIYLRTLSFYLLRRTTGQTIWQKTLVEGQQQQQAVILGSDTQFIYVALLEAASPSLNTATGTKLLALNQATGQLAWQVFAPTPSGMHLQDGGKLLVEQHHITWQVAGSIYVITTPQGKIQWQKSIAEGRPELLLQEETQMTEVGGVLVVERSDAYHALDLASGNERRVFSNPGGDTSIDQAAHGLAAAANALLLYGHGEIDAIDVNNQHILWSQKRLDAIQNLHLSVDGKLIYATVTASVEGSVPTQALVAIDSSNGALRWTFQPFAQVTFLPLRPDGILYRHSILLTTVCTSSTQDKCTHVILYALNAESGKTVWKYQGNSIDDVHISADARTLAFQSNSSPWQDLLGRLGG